jgi:hypothetical protein
MPSHEIFPGLVQVYQRGRRAWHCSTSLKHRTSTTLDASVINARKPRRAFLKFAP